MLVTDWRKYSKILESLLHLGNSFYEFLLYLQRREDEDLKIIASIIRNYADTDIKTNINYIETSFNKNDEISFIPDSQYQRALNNKEDINKKSKNFTNIGRAIRQLLIAIGQKPTDKQIEKVVNEYKKYWDNLYSDKKFEIVTGDKILHAYLIDNYYENRGTLGGSCMSNRNRNSYMRLYAENPKTVSLAVIYKENKIVARGLLWLTEDNEYFLDRIYYIDTSDYMLLETRVKNYLGDKPLKSYQSDEYIPNTIKVMLEKTQFDEYPYLDNLPFLYEELDEKGKIKGNGFLTRAQESSYEKTHVISSIQSTEGTKHIISHKYSTIMDRWILNYECVWDKNVEDWIIPGQVVYSKYKNRYYLKTDVTYSESIKDYIPNRDLLEHKKFGLIPKDKLFKVIKSYKGERSEDPLFIAKLLSDKKLDDFESEDMLLIDDRYDYITIKDNIVLISDKLDLNENDVNELLCYKIVKLKEESVEDLKESGLNFLIFKNNYILKIDSEILGIEYMEENLIYYKKYVIEISPTFYYERIKGDYIEEVKDKDLKERRSSILESIHNYMIEKMPGYGVRSKISNVDLVELYSYSFYKLNQDRRDSLSLAYEHSVNIFAENNNLEKIERKELLQDTILHQLFLKFIYIDIILEDGAFTDTHNYIFRKTTHVDDIDHVLTNTNNSKFVTFACSEKKNQYVLYWIKEDIKKEFEKSLKVYDINVNDAIYYLNEQFYSNDDIHDLLIEEVKSI